jgi:hypothetical protein
MAAGAVIHWASPNVCGTDYAHAILFFGAASGG